LYIKLIDSAIVAIQKAIRL